MKKKEPELKQASDLPGALWGTATDPEIAKQIIRSVTIPAEEYYFDFEGSLVPEAGGRVNFTPHPEIHAEVLPCATCSGKGERLKVDPLDLKLFRDKTCKLPLAAFRRGIINPNTGRPPSIGFLFLVESIDAKGRPRRACPLWLYEAYVSIPEREWDRRKRATGEQLKEYRRVAAEKNLDRYLDVFAPDEALTRTDVSRRLNVPYKTARLYLGKLVAAGELVEMRTDTGKAFAYMLAHPERIRRS